MVSYTSDALGQAVRDLRRAGGLTQEELGVRAGYKSGPAAGVSISRLEKGRLVDLSSERFERLAEALGVSAEDLVRAAESATERPEATREGLVTIRDRADWIQRVIDSRTKLVTDLGQAFDDAQAGATEAFLKRLVEIAGRVGGVTPPALAQLMGDLPPDEESAEAEAAYGLRFTRYGVANALAETAVGLAAVGAAAEHSRFADAVVRGIAPAGTEVAQAGAAATTAFINAMRVGTSPAGRASITVGRHALLAGLIAAPVALATGLLVRTAQRSRKQQQELTAKLAEAEKRIDESQRNVDALSELMTSATEILEYIAVHAGHALSRWETEISQGVLQPAQKHRYEEFVAIAASQLAVANLDFETLMTSRDSELDHAIELARETLAQSRTIVTSYV